MEEQVLSILRRVLENPNIDSSCSWDNCEKWDSLHHLEICFDLEEEFGISIEPEDMQNIKSYNDIISFLKKN